MKLGKYTSLNGQDIKSAFLDYVSALEIPVIDYVAIGVQDSIHKTSTSIMSRPEWQKTFKELNLAEFDPVRKASFNTTSKIFSFDSLDYENSNGKEVMRQRKLHDINNGIVLMQKNLGYNFMLTLATGYKNFDAYKFFIDNHAAMQRVFCDLISLVSPGTKEYQIKITNQYHQDVDAK